MSWQGHNDRLFRTNRGGKASAEIYNFVGDLMAKQYQPKKVDSCTEFGIVEVSEKKEDIKNSSYIL